MRKEVLKFEAETNRLPQIGIIFIGNRAVVSIRSEKDSPRGHRDVWYGLFFWWRLKRATKKVWKELLNKTNS